MIATTPEQSSRLLACGINSQTADMYLSVNLNKGENYGKYSVHILNHVDSSIIEDIMEMRDHVLAWSLSAALNLLPKHLDDFPFTKWYQPFLKNEIVKIYSEEVLNGDVKLYSNGTNWIVDYEWDGFSGKLPQSENPIEAIVLAIELLHANGYNFTNTGNEQE